LRLLIVSDFGRTSSHFPMLAIPIGNALPPITTIFRSLTTFACED